MMEYCSHIWAGSSIHFGWGTELFAWPCGSEDHFLLKVDLYMRSCLILCVYGN